MEYIGNYNLPQWAATDRVLREDFNEAFDAIDTALGEKCKVLVGTYAGDGKVSNSRTYEWPHSISEIIGSLLRAGLTIERFDEGQTLPWRFSPRMEELSDGNYAWPETERHIVPCTFTIVARKR